MYQRTGRVVQINISDGGVPKLPIPEARITPDGVAGDRQRNTKHHGGARQKLCVFSMDVIRRLRDEGHPIEPGGVGENLTIEGLDWAALGEGDRLVFEGGVEIEIPATPCATIRDSFKDLDSKRISAERHPGESRLYARVIREGTLRPGERVEMNKAGDAAV